jgi:hypothetical protein
MQAGQQRQAQVAQYHPDPNQLPPVEQDPIQHIVKRLQLSEQREAARMQQEAQAAQQSQAIQVIGNLHSQAVRLEKEFEAKQPDYSQAIEYLRSGASKELEMRGVPSQLPRPFNWERTRPLRRRSRR